MPVQKQLSHILNSNQLITLLSLELLDLFIFGSYDRYLHPKMLD